MKDDPTKDLIRALEELLDLERKALIEGELDLLGHMLLEKERLVDAIGALQVPNEEYLLKVQKKVERNQALLDSAMEGIRAVANRMAELHRVRQGLHTYDAAGQRNSYPVRQHAQLEKKA